MREKRVLLLILLAVALLVDWFFVVPFTNGWFWSYMTADRIHQELDIQNELHPGSPAAAVGNVQIYVVMMFCGMHAITTLALAGAAVWFVSREWNR